MFTSNRSRIAASAILSQLLEPVTTFLVPIFFVLMGIRVDLRVFGQLNLIGFALALTIAAIMGKQICSLAVAERGLNRLAIGIGMIPRGEVGLIVAGIGATLMLPNVAGVIVPVVSAETFGAVVIMVVITTSGNSSAFEGSAFTGTPTAVRKQEQLTMKAAMQRREAEA